MDVPGKGTMGQTWTMADQPDGRPSAEDRLSDAERERAVELLQKHTGDGRLTLDEFSERVGGVYAARSRADLEPLFSDLPSSLTPVPADLAPTSAGGQVAETRRRRVTRWVVAVMSGAKRTGRWRPGEHVAVVAVMGGCHLDLCKAEIDVNELTITAVAVMGGIRIDVPEGIEVELTGLPIMGGKDLRLADVALIPGAPVIRVRAFPIMGGVEVRSVGPHSKKHLGDQLAQGIDQLMQGKMQEKLQRHQERLARRQYQWEDHVARAHRHAGRAIERAREEWQRALEQVGAPEPVVLRTPPVPKPPWPPPDPASPSGVPPPATARPAADPTPAAAAAPPAQVAEDAEDDAGDPTAPDGTVTILFSDICGSTAMNERLGDLLAHEVLRQHADIVRSQVAAHGGYDVKSQGDGVMVAFAGASRALRCAVGIQRTVHENGVKHPNQVFSVHVGLHTGETIRERDDFLGRTVILASRITAAATADEVLVSSLLKELTDGTGEFSFGPVREVSLKGISQLQRVYPVEWEETVAAW